MLVYELLDEIINYLVLAFQHGKNPGPENLLKLLYFALGKHIKGPPIFTKKAVSTQTAYSVSDREYCCIHPLRT